MFDVLFSQYLHEPIKMMEEMIKQMMKESNGLEKFEESLERTKKYL